MPVRFLRDDPAGVLIAAVIALITGGAIAELASINTGAFADAIEVLGWGAWVAAAVMIVVGGLSMIAKLGRGGASRDR